MKKKRILVAAAGTSTAWHIACLCQNGILCDNFEIYTADVNPKHLVPASTLAIKHFQVLPVLDSDYREQMLSILKENRIDIFVPLIDDDLYVFPADDPDLLSLGIKPASVLGQSGKILKDKEVLARYLLNSSIVVPSLVSDIAQMDSCSAKQYFVKPKSGFGSRGARTVNSVEAGALLMDKSLTVQEECSRPEVTVEVYHANGITKTLCRERIEVKAGVCTKAKIWWDGELHQLALNLVAIIALPEAFCFQVMRNGAGRWAVIDINARMGAGTALSSAAGWSLASAALVTWGECDVDPVCFLGEIPDPIFVTRVYSELVMATE